jgi:toxin FitB
MDGTACLEWAPIMDLQSEDLLEDAMIAAIARVHHLAVATRSEADFSVLKIPHLNPFKNWPLL